MFNRSKTIEQARSWLETPFHKDACLKHVGVDCVRFCMDSYKAGGVVFPKMETLQRVHGIGGTLLLDKLNDAGFFQIHNPLPGDLVVWDYSGSPAHIGILTVTNTEPNRVIHACPTMGAVYEHAMVGQWLNRINSYFTPT